MFLTLNDVNLRPVGRANGPKPLADATVSPSALVGRDGLEPSTSRLSGVRSNHLSYRPILAPTPCDVEGWWSLSGSNR